MAVPIAASFLAVVALAASSQPLSRETSAARHYRLLFPAIALEKDERIDALTVEVRCGYIKGVLPAPEDWSFEVRTISRVATLNAAAGHGASWLWDIRPWNRVIAIQPYDTSCFDVTATVYSTFYEEKNSQRTFSRRQLKLVP
jgi:hypothetical protein